MTRPVEPSRHGLPSAVVFDLDGVLLDTTENMRHAFTACCREAGRRDAPSFAEFLTHMGAPLPQILTAVGLPAALAATYERESTNQIGLVRPYDGITALLRDLLAGGVPTSVATGKATWRAVQMLERTGLRPLLGPVVGSDRVARPKPAPEIVLTALRESGAEPAGAMFLGDSPLDMRAGHGAGVTVVAAGWGQGAPAALLAEGPHRLIDHPRELLEPLAAGGPVRG
ncbi:HAD-IA family hydrolase [Actinomadura viridis]|uniref:3-amino-5-hydroxybenzoic acid synthesis related protein n=1 Tax=Actinomadura viridis TaxID=58110 RepID=A0A931GGM0_9ACTN|nr:HAD family hydrolase [Actinomadura viridis]MBG6085937.1 3-amino-5-hydroxybenzoic acid synthesis related protein [Actinomadura viridis]